MPNCCEPISQAHLDHLEVLGIDGSPSLTLGIQKWSLVHLIKSEVDDLEASASKMVSTGLISVKLASLTGSFPLWGSCHVQSFSREVSCDCSLGFFCVEVVMEVSEGVFAEEEIGTSDLSRLPSF